LTLYMAITAKLRTLPNPLETESCYSLMTREKYTFSRVMLRSPMAPKQ
jgi:hypothetical protein